MLPRLHSFCFGVDGLGARIGRILDPEKHTIAVIWNLTGRKMDDLSDFCAELENLVPDAADRAQLTEQIRRAMATPS